MRDIKYRVWDKDDKCMYQVDSINFPLGKLSGKDITVYNEKEDCYEWVYNNYELMEYIGLKDINRKEIYEGDIVEFMHSGEKHMSVIYYKELEGFYFEFTYEDYRYKFSVSDLKITHRKTMVIGNQYENPELLDQISN